MTTIEARRLTKIYREGPVEVPAVREVDLSVAAGEVLAIMGPSGSGKTTLLSMLGCILRPTGGSIMICGEQVAGLDEHRLPRVRRRYVGFIFQSFNLFAALTAAENVEMVLEMKGIRGRAAKKQAIDLLEAVSLADRAHALPRELSGGQKQRVSIARALAGNPPVVLADEPTANLDWKSGEQVVRMLRDAAKSENRTVIVVTHDHRILPYIDRSVHIEDGQVTAG